jgi:hypothetical protein
MSVVDDLLERFREMDSVDRQNMYFAIAGLIVLLLLIYSLGPVLDVMGTFLGKGSSMVNQTASTAKNLSIIR